MLRSFSRCILGILLGLLLLTGCDGDGGTGTEPPGDTNTLTVRSSNPDDGVNISVSPADSDGAGNGITPFSRTYADGTDVTLTAPPESPDGTVFLRWEQGSTTVSTDVEARVTLAQNRTLTAVYEAPDQQYALAVTSEAPDSGVDIDVSPADANGEGSGTTPFDRRYDAGTDVTLTAPETTTDDRVFVRWILDEENQDRNVRELTVPMNAERTARAVYEAPRPVVTLTIASANPDTGVEVDVSPADVNGDGAGVTLFERQYRVGDEVTLTAPAEVEGQTFERWRVDGADGPEGEQTLSITLDTDRTARAVYSGTAQLNELTVRSANPASGVEIVVVPADVDGAANGKTEFTRRYATDTEVTLTAPTDSGDGTVFARWEEAGQTLSDTPDLTVIMSEGRLVTAVYEAEDQQFTLTVDDAGLTDGALVAVAPTDANGDSDGTTAFERTYASGTVVSLTAPEDAEGQPFVRWQLDGSSQPADQRSLSLTMTANRSAIAIYDDSPPVFTVAVASENPNTGVGIQVSPADVDGAGDGTTVFERRYEEGTTVTFTAPEETTDGRLFDRWRLDGDDQDEGARTLSFNVTQNHSVTARYVIPPSEPSPSATLVDTSYAVGGRPSGLPAYQMQRELGVLALSSSILNNGHVGLFHLRDGGVEPLPDTYLIDLSDDGTPDTEVTFSFNASPGEVLLDLTAADQGAFLHPSWLPDRVLIVLITEANLPGAFGDDVDLSDYSAVADYYGLPQTP